MLMVHMVQTRGQTCGVVKWGTDLVSKPDAGTKADSANDEHGQILSKGTQDGAYAEGSASKNHDQLSATNARHWSSEEAEESSCRQCQT